MGCRPCADAGGRGVLRARVRDWRGVAGRRRCADLAPDQALLASRSSRSPMSPSQLAGGCLHVCLPVPVPVRIYRAPQYVFPSCPASPSAAWCMALLLLVHDVMWCPAGTLWSSVWYGRQAASRPLAQASLLCHFALASAPACTVSASGIEHQEHACCCRDPHAELRG